MKLDFEYGQGLMSANLPDNTDIFVPGETVPDPECLPQDWDTLYGETLKSIRNPIGMKPLRELAHKGSTVVIIIPDIVKGGNQPTSHRKVAIRACIDELYSVGVEKKDILLLFSNGLHPRTSVPEMKTILGDELFGEFYYTGQITSHDSEDYEHLVDLGYTDHGDHVIMNKYVYDADVAILIGHTQGNPYGGYSGGYKHCATGISHWRSISAHHVPQVMHRADFVPVSTHSEMRNKFDQQGMFMEEKMGKKFFCCDAVLDSKSRQIAIFSGYAKEMQPISWELADKRTAEAKEKQFAAYTKVTLDNLFSQMAQNDMKELAIVVKADVQGSAEAVKQSLEKISNDEVRVRVIHAGVGAISKSDVDLADASNAIIIGFNVRPDNVAKEEAAATKVEMRMYRVIYDAINDVTDAMKGMLAPKFREVSLGELQVRQVYKISNVGTVAGCRVTSGKITRDSKVRVVRDGIVIAEDEIASLKRFKDDAKEVAEGYECGVTLEKFADVKEGDVYEAFKMEEYRD